MPVIPFTEANHFHNLVQAWQRTYARCQQITELPPSIVPTNTSNRSSGDALAAWLRYHDSAVSHRFRDGEWLWYAVLERARVETLATQQLPGMARNLGKLHLTQPCEAKFVRVYHLARQVLSAQSNIDLTNIQRPTQITVQGSSTWLRWLQYLKGFHKKYDTHDHLSDEDITTLLQPAIAELQDCERFADVIQDLVGRLNAESDGTSSDLITQHDFTKTSDELDEHPEAEQTLLIQQDKLTIEAEREGVYKVFSRQWDECLPAHKLSNAEDIALLHSLNQTTQHPQLRRLAHQLQRRLLSSRLRHWSFDQEQGVLDNRKLARLVISESSHNIFRQEYKADVPEACVIFLVDQSGSMRGERQRLATLAIDLAVHTLETCRINTEVLGFTTRFFEDNPINKAWVQRGCPSNPGRLNGLRHIIYKQANQPWRQARRDLGLMLRKGFGCENIDGEALNWATSRLLMRPEPRKILVVLSDGIPYDEATVCANGRGFLESHLHAAIQSIQKMSIHLAAIGTGTNVGRFYTNALTLQEYDEIAEVLFEHLADLLT
jgi:cobaltochelatase CobT